MRLKKWNELPSDMKTDELRPYYDIIKKKQYSLAFKRGFDFIIALIVLIVLSPVMIIIAALIKIDSNGTVFYRQIRITQYGREFKIFKFRTMVVDADKKGSLVTVNKDERITSVGRLLRKYRLDELPQLINILLGDMSFVGTRPEVPRYTDRYTNEMKATLLMPAGVTSLASIEYKDEETLLSDADNADDVYLEKILPNKMSYNLLYLKKFKLWEDIGLMIKTVFSVFKDV